MKNNLEALRKARGIKQEELAEALEVSGRPSARWKTGVTTPPSCWRSKSPATSALPSRIFSSTRRMPNETQNQRLSGPGHRRTAAGHRESGAGAPHPGHGGRDGYSHRHGLFAYGFSKFRTLRWEEKEPEIMRKAEIEANDERNVAIRRRAQAVSGEALQWTILVAAWVSIGLDAPLWVTVAAVGVFLAKSFLDLFLIFHYRKQM